LAGDLQTKVGLENRDIWERTLFTSSTSLGSRVEEISNTTTDNDVTLPGRVTFGVGLENLNKWTLAVEYERAQWSAFDGFIYNNQYLDSNRFALGFMVVPDASAFNDYLKTVEYRVGAYYNSGILSIENTEIRQYGATFGFGLPVRRNTTRIPNFSRLNLSFDIGQRGTTDNSLVLENYFKTTFGITLNDKWFVKKKFD